MWSQPFLITVPSGEQVAVILIDTQGTFDIETIVQECATVISLSLLISSVQIFNLSRNITENDLQHLLLFTEYARQPLGDDCDRPFQTLQLLVRDWATPHLALFGPDGGQQLFGQLMKTNVQQTEEAQWMRNRIRSSFSKISCYLMPHPGKKVTIEENYNGKIADARPQFRDQLARLVPLLLSPESLQGSIKVSQGRPITAGELCQLFEAYVDFFSSRQLPVAKPTSAAAADVRNLKVVSQLAEVQFRFLSIMFRGAESCYIDPDYVGSIDDTVKAVILKMFSDERCIGGPELAQKHKEKLEQTMDLQSASLQSSTAELELMSEGVCGDVLASLRASLHGAAGDTEEATATLEGIGAALARYDAEGRLALRLDGADEAVREAVQAGRRLAEDDGRFTDLVEDLCAALERDSGAASRQAAAKIEGLGVALAVLSAGDRRDAHRLSADEIDALYAKVEKGRLQRPSARPDLVSRLTPREMRVLKVKKNIAMVFPFYNF
ncbi:atlastin-like isoform X2 [Bacillus rossius redtenbacheri]